MVIMMMSARKKSTIQGRFLVRSRRSWRILVFCEAEGATLIGRGSGTYDALGVLGADSPETVAEKTLARITRQIADTHGCS